MAATHVMDQLAALGYSVAYDGVVRGFRPYEALLDEIARRIAWSVPSSRPRSMVRVLDVACGTGTLARRLSRDGYHVVGLDTVPRLVSIARRSPGAGMPGGMVFHACDIARDPVPGAGAYEALVSLHTLYWHPDPEAFLDGCRRALRPGGHAVILTYARPARVVRTFREVARQVGPLEAARALRWLVPTAAFELLRRGRRRYLDELALRRVLQGAGFEVLETVPTFLGGISAMAWVRAGR